MAKRKTKKKTKRPPLKDRVVAWWYDLDLSAVKRGLMGLLWTLGVAGLVAAVGLGVPRLEAFVAGATTTDAMEIRFVDPPAWLQGDLETWLMITAPGGAHRKQPPSRGPGSMSRGAGRHGLL